MHDKDDGPVRCGLCGEAIARVRRGWWTVVSAPAQETYAFCSSNCAAAFFEDRELRELRDLARRR